MKRFVSVVVLVILVITFIAVPAVFAAGSGSQTPPSWTVYQETLASREVWYAYARADIRQYKAEALEVGDKIILHAKSGNFEAEITEFLTPLAASDPHSPTRMWISFEPADGVPKGLPSYTGVIFARWGPF
ncbi:MAG: hypothetical protein FJZ05_01345 [Candidatus Nealsonbacteria bacterium]|nr:hypothetical protein [Candidatus Nealsonbacteria bacterium]